MENTANNKYFNGEHNHCTDFSRILAELTMPIIIERAPRIQLCRVVNKRTLLCTGTQRTRRHKKNRGNVTGIHAEPELGQIYEFETRYDEILKRATDEYVLPSKYYRDGLNKVLTVQTEPQAIRTIKTFSSVWLTASSPSNLV